MDEKRLEEIEKKWRKHFRVSIGDMDDLLAEVKRLREERAELIAQNALLSDFILNSKKEA